MVGVENHGDATRAADVQTGAWISIGIENLYARQQQTDKDIVFDVLIVGSGYGGSIAANELAQYRDKGLKIAILERGREFLPGSFPNSVYEAPTEVRFSKADGSKPKGNLEGLFDMRLGKDLNILQANGLGGGSLINAGVMARAKNTIFTKDSSWNWPDQISSTSLAPYYSEVERLLGATIDNGINARPNTIFQHRRFNDKGPKKYEFLKRLSRDAYSDDNDSTTFKDVPITINMIDGAKTSAGITLNACNLCGDCASGCNNNSKISLDKNLLVNATNNGVEIFTGVTVNSLKKERDHNNESLWLLNTVYTNSRLRSREQETERVIKTRHVILSAGAIGSTEILMRSRQNGLSFSDKLGKQFSSNGDMMVVGYAHNQEVNAVASPNIAQSKRNIGPTISGMIDLRGNRDKQQQIVIQEMAVPAVLSHFFTELYSTTAAVRDIWNIDKTRHTKGNSFNDPAAITSKAVQNTSLYAAMGDDGAEGKLRFIHSDASQHEGTLTVEWAMLREHQLFSNQSKKIATLSGGLGGMIIPNPFWELLKPSSMKMLNIDKGPPLTVHPLGGCPMGETVALGVTNHQGRVFDAKGQGFHDGLIVLDGAIIPNAVGINPALTISAICLKAIRELIGKNTFLSKNSKPKSVNRDVTQSRISKYRQVPVSRTLEELEAETVRPKKETKVNITERLVGFSRLKNNNGSLENVVIELTLWTEPQTINDFSAYHANTRADRAKLIIDSNKLNEFNDRPLSTIRLYKRQDWNDIRAGKKPVDISETVLDNAALFIGSIQGQISVLGRAESRYHSRILKGLYAWLFNRGIRDLFQLKPLESIKNSSRSMNETKTIWRTRFLDMCKSLTHAGEIRTLDYRLSVKDTLKDEDFSYFGAYDTHPQSRVSQYIIGKKKISYTRRSNPWLQLSELQLEQIPEPTGIYGDVAVSNRKFGGFNAVNFFVDLIQAYRPRQHMLKTKSSDNKLRLDLNYLASTGKPLLEISEQENQIQALLDTTSFISYAIRVLIGIHFYSFRAPELVSRDKADDSHRSLSGLPKARIKKIIVGNIPDNKAPTLTEGSDVSIVLTCFQHKSSTKPPILMIHGYSACSTTFAHKSLPNSLAKTCFDEGRDVWLVDLRTSSRLATARYPWSFEQVAEKDIPTAINYIYEYYNRRSIDIVAHCMGSAMLGMSILKFTESDCGRKADFFKKRLNRIVFSQATPANIFTPDNNFRSFATRYLKKLIPDDYQFQPTEKQTTKVLDRILYTLPYPEKEYDTLNSTFTPHKRAGFARTRHRMDAFYTRTFELNNVSTKTLLEIDDFFGPMHIDTIIQASLFANNNVITDNKGVNNYLSRENIQKYWGQIPTMSFHSKNNGLIDFSTGERTKRIFREAGVPYQNRLIEEERYGHQDSIIGPEAHRDVFPLILDFLNDENTSNKHNINNHRPTGSHLIIEPPYLGPLIVEIEPTPPSLDTTTKEVRIAFGTNPARAAKPRVIFLPVIREANIFSLALHQDQCPKKFIQNHLTSLQQPKIGNDPRWQSIDIPVSLLENQQSNGTALFLIYDDLQSLCPDFKTTQSQLDLARNERTISSEETCSDEDICNAIWEMFKTKKSHFQQYFQGLIELQEKSSDKLTFALASCQYPGGILDKKVAYRSYELLNKRLENSEPNKPTFMTLLGDQVYVDATAGFLDPVTEYEKYSLPYIQLYKRPQVRAVLRKLPSFNMIDDHELVDNWEPGAAAEPLNQVVKDIYKKGVSAYLKYQRAEQDFSSDDSNRDPLWYSFTKQGHDFFMCDTRTQRTVRTAENILAPNTTILGEKQHTSLEYWLKSPKTNTKFVLSSSMLLPRSLSSHGNDATLASLIRIDSWSGYPNSLNRILAFLVDNRLENIVFLSGDAHIACFAEIEIENLDNQEKVSTWSIHCPGLYTPFPFANNRPDHYEGALDLDQSNKISEFNFLHNNTNYSCKTRARFGHSDNEELSIGPIHIETLGGFLLINSP